MTDFQAFFSDIINQIKVEFTNNFSDEFESVEIGPVNFNRLKYPLIHIIPDTSTYNGNLEYENRINIYYYFEKGRNQSNYISNLETVEDTLDNIILKMESNSSTINYKVDNIEHLAGESNNNLLQVINVEFLITKSIEYNDIT